LAVRGGGGEESNGVGGIGLVFGVGGNCGGVGYTNTTHYRKFSPISTNAVQ
jgi:hypothetical protein